MTQTKRNVPFFNYPFVFTSHEEDYVNIFKDVGRRGAFVLQKDLEEFEANLAEYSGSKYALGMSNATDALQLGVMAGGIKEGDEVIISSHTMVATASAIHYAGGKVVPVDAGRDLQIDPESIKKAITSKTKAICPTQLNGRVSDMAAIQKIADDHGLDIYEDAAQSLGAKFQGRGAGTFGIASCISFYPAKTLGSFGDAGAVLCQDEEVYEKLKLLRDHGRHPERGVINWAFNARLDNMQAAFLNYNLKIYPQTVERRREIAARYCKNLSDVSHLVLPPAPGSESERFDIFQNFEIQAQKRDQLKTYLADHGIGTLIQWNGQAIHHMKELGFTQELPQTDKLFDEIIMIPLNMSVTDEDVDYVSEVIRDFYKNN